MVKIRYDRWAGYLHELVKNECPKRSLVLELGAGDGTFARYFTKYFPHIIVTDISHQMLNSKMNSLPRVCCNMLAIPFKTKFDLIYSNFDSVNYLLSGKLLVRLFNEVALNLNDGGVFTFDICRSGLACFWHAKKDGQWQRRRKINSYFGKAGSLGRTEQ